MPNPDGSLTPEEEEQVRAYAGNGFDSPAPGADVAGAASAINRGIPRVLQAIDPPIKSIPGMLGMGGEAQAAEVPAVPEPAAPAPVEPAPPDVPPPAVPAPARPRPSGGGGGGGQPDPARAAEAVARGGEKTAEEGQLANIQQATELAERKAVAEGVQTADEAAATKAHYKEIDDKYAAAKTHLDKETEKAANFKIRDQFEGRQGAGIAAALMRGLGAYAAIKGGGPNYAGEVLDAAAKDFRSKQVIQLEQLNKNVANEKDAQHNVMLEADSKEAGFWKNMAQARAGNMAKFGYDTARIEGDKTYQDALSKSAVLNRQVETGLVERKEREKLQASQIAENYASADRSRAGAAKDRAEAAAPPKENSRGINDARQRAMLVTGLEDQNKIVMEMQAHGVKLDEKDLQTIQDNRTYLKALEHGDKGTSDALGTVLMRKLGAVPRSDFDGLTPSKKRLAGAYNQMTQKAALLNAGSMTSEAITHAAAAVDLLAPNQGAEEHARRVQYIRTDLIGANKGLVPGQAAAARAGATTMAPQELTQKPTAGEMAQVMAARAKAKPGSPDFARYDAMAKRMQAEMGR